MKKLLGMFKDPEKGFFVMILTALMVIGIFWALVFRP